MISFCAAVSSLCAYAGGMIFPPEAKTRSTISLCSGDPGTIGAVDSDAVATDAATYRTLATRAYRLAKELFAPPRIAASTLALYASLLQSNR